MLEWIGKRYMRMQEIRHGEGGFTLIELIVVVTIIGILAAIALPVFLGQRARAADATAKANVREAAGAVNVYFTEEGTNPGGNVALLQGKGFTQSDPPVNMTSAGDAANATWCVHAPTDGGEEPDWKMDETDGHPVPGIC